jgi:hypothetical protein
MTQTIINLGTGGAVLNGQNGSTAGADSNDALFLNWPGDNQGNYVYLSGVNSNFLSVPDEAALDITGDIDIRVYAALDSWALNGFEYLIAKYGAPGARSFRIYFDPSTNLNFSWSVDGTNDVSAVFTNPGIPAGTPKWIRFTLDVNNGAGGYTAKAFTSDDGVTYTQFDTDKTGVGVTSIFNSAVNVSIPGAENGSSVLAGKFYRTQIFNGIAGTKVLDIDTSVITSGSATSLTALTGQTVTINRSTSGRKSVAVVSPVWLFGTDDFMQVADNGLIDFGASNSFTAMAVIRQWATRVASQPYLIKRGDSSPNVGWTLQQNASSNNATMFIDDGPNATGQQGTTLTLGQLTAAFGVVNRISQTMLIYNNASVSSPVSTSAVGSLANDFILRIGQASGYQDFELISVSIFRRALSAAEVSAITSYYQARLS